MVEGGLGRNILKPGNMGNVQEQLLRRAVDIEDWQYDFNSLNAENRNFKHFDE